MQSTPDVSCWFQADGPIPEHRRKAWNIGASPRRPTSLANWLIYCPHLDPLWEHWIASVGRTQKGHELCWFAADPCNDEPGAVLDLITFAEPCMRHVIDGAEDAQAVQLLEHCIFFVVGGALIPSRQSAHSWKALIDRELKRSAKVEKRWASF